MDAATHLATDPDDPCDRMAAILARADRLRIQYVTPMADGRCITDNESFVVDIVADVLIYAAAKMGADWNDLADAVETSLEHARHELNAAEHAAEQRAEEEASRYDAEGHGTWVVTDDLRAARAVGRFLRAFSR